jgi:hypothetical protein
MRIGTVIFVVSKNAGGEYGVSNTGLGEKNKPS